MTTPGFPLDFLDRLEAAVLARAGRRERDEVRFRCPSGEHADTHPSARWNRTKAAWCCDVCRTGSGALALAALLGVALPPRAPGGRGDTPTRKPIEHSHTAAGCTLAAYAAAKRLPESFLRDLGLSDISYQRAPAVRIPYRNPDGTEAAVQYRVRLAKGAGSDDRFRWKSGAKARLYGLDRLDRARERGHITIVEGASDCQTLWFHDVPAIGLPGAGNWNDGRDAAHLDGIDTIYVVIEPDAGGAAVTGWLATSAIRDRVRLVDLSPYKDPSALHIDEPDRFRERWQIAIDAAIPWTEQAAKETSAEAADAWASCQDLARDPNILARVQSAMRARGYAGDLTPPTLGYVALTSRLLDRPLNLAFVAQSGAGKNRALDAGTELVPPEAFYLVKAASSRTLVYNDEDFEHRVVIFGEADSIPEDGPAATAIRNLAADNVMEYEVVERDEQTGKWGTRKISKPGPTGLMTTSTRSLREQMGTRLLEVSLSDDAMQTYTIMLAHAASVMPRATAAIDLAPFHSLQRWLALVGERRVAVPFAAALVEALPRTAVRMRRDVRQLLTCIQTVALLHQAQRDRTPEGWVVATIEDYAIAHGLLSAVFDTVAAEGVTPAIRATIEAVQDGEEVSAAVLATRLNLAKSTVSWRVQRALKGGWLVNNETRRGAALKLARGVPLPEETSALPSPDALRQAFECSSASRYGASPPPPTATGLQAVYGKPWLRANDDDQDWPHSPLNDDDGRPICADCGGPAPADGMHWCAACRATASAVAS